MANLTAYGTGTPKASDLLLGTKTAAPNTNEENITQNFSVSSLASFTNSYSLGYTVYTAALTQPAASAPVATVLQNTTGGTFTWSYVGVGQFKIAVSGITLPANKVAMFMSSGSGESSLGGKITTTTQIDLEQFSVTADSYTNGMAAGTSIEIRIYS